MFVLPGLHIFVQWFGKCLQTKSLGYCGNHIGFPSRELQFCATCHQKWNILIHILCLVV